MQLTRSLWSRVLQVDGEFTRRGEHLSRRKLKEVFKICEYDARFLHEALQHRDVISLKTDTTFAVPGEVELVLSDIHIPFQDKLALEAVLAYAEKLNPSIITLLGDTIDFYKISRFVKNPLQKSVSAEVKMCRQFLTELRQRFPKARIILYRGNHEERLDHYIMAHAGEIYDLIEGLLENALGLRELNIEYKTEPFKVGKLNHLHGHEKGGGMYNPEYVTNVVFNFVLDSFICGHFHRSQDKVFRRIDKSIFLGLATGYLAGDMEYARLNKWNQGFAMIEYGERGKFRARGFRVMDGEIF